MDEWNTGEKTEIAKECTYCPKQTAQFILSDELFSVINALCERIETEWQMLLSGTVDEDTNVVRCTGFYIPKQEVTSSTVTNIDCIDKEFIDENNIVATIHSHSDMGVFFSNTDEEHTNTSLIQNHMVVNNKGEYTGTRAILLPCGLKRFIDARVLRDMPDVPKAKKIKGFKNIEKKTHYNTIYGNGYAGSGLARHSTFEHDDPWLKGNNGKRKKHGFHFG